MRNQAARRFQRDTNNVVPTCLVRETNFLANKTGAASALAGVGAKIVSPGAPFSPIISLSDSGAGAAPSMKAKIIITPKKAVVDPQGKTVQSALAQMGY